MTSTGNVTVTMNTSPSRSCTFTITNSTQGSCTYTVQTGDVGGPLNPTISGTIRDVSNNAMSNYTPITPLTSSKTINIDAQAPFVTSVTATNANGSYRAGENIVIQVVFNENATLNGGPPTLDLATGNPASTELSYISGSGSNTYTFLYEVQQSNFSNDLDYASNASLDLNGGFVYDTLINSTSSLTLPNPGASGSLGANKNIVIDNTPPTVAISSSESDPTNVSPIPITATFDESVTGVQLGDIEVTNGTASNLAGSGSTRTFDVTPSGQGNVTVQIPAGRYQDLAGNENEADSNLFEIVFDSVRPTTLLESNVGDWSNSSPVPFTVEFSEDMSEFVAGDISVVNGTVDNFQSVDAANYTFDIIPNSQGTVEVSIPQNVATDGADNNNFASSAIEFIYDTIAPELNSIDLDSLAIAKGQTTTVNFEFSENVQNFDLSDISVGSGVLSNLATSDNGTTWSATYTPDVDIEEFENFIVVDLSQLEDLASNVGSGTESSVNYVVDTLAPRVATITSSTPSGRYVAGDVINISVMFTELVTTNGDIVVVLNSNFQYNLCTIELTSEISGSCAYEVQQGDFASSLAVATVLGDITDEIGNEMENFEPISNLANNKEIEVDNDSVPASMEDNAPNNGDGNGDGVADSQQPHVLSFFDSISQNYVTLAAREGLYFSQGSELDATVVDGRFSYPFGLITFTLQGLDDGETVTIEMFIESDLDSDRFELRKFFPTNNSYTQMQGASITNDVIGDTGMIKVVFSLQDGGAFDLDGQANGVIVDPVGVAQLPVIGDLADTGRELLNNFLFATLILLFGAIFVCVSNSLSTDRFSSDR